MTAQVVKVRHAAVLPHEGKWIVWAQSPNGTWMLIAGHYWVKAHAKTFAIKAGYFILDNEDRALALIEQQMGERMILDSPNEQRH